MKKILVIFLLIATVSFADELKVPFSCYPQELKQCLKDNGFIVELSAEIRNEDTWGFIVNEGNKWTLQTYNPVTEEELVQIQKIIFDFYKDK